MLKRFSSLILALLLGGNALAGTAARHGERLCEIAGMEMTPAVEITPNCKEHESRFVLSEPAPSKQCCFTSPQETGSRGTTFNLSARYFSIAISHPAADRSSLPVLKAHRSSYSQVLPNLQDSYIRNLSLLI